MKYSISLCICFCLVLAALFTAQTLYASWFQTVSGDVHSEGGIDFNPGAVPFHASVEDFTSTLIVGDSGFISHDDGTPTVSLGSETPELSGDSGTDWVVQSGSFAREGNKYGYSYFDQMFSSKTDLSSVPNLIQGSCSQVAPSGAYSYSGTLTIGCSGDLVLPSGEFVFFINGNLNINSRVKLASDSDFVAFIVTGDIVIQAGADGGSMLDTDVQGVYIADERIIVGPDTQPIFLEGMFIGWDNAGTGQGIRLRRDSGNPDEVMETFIFRPELLFYLPTEMWEQQATWEEVDP